MKKSVLFRMKMIAVFTVILVSSFAIVSNISTGKITGKVTEKGTGDPIPYANVIIMQKGIQIDAVVTGTDGSYTSKALPTGTYNMIISFIGYETFKKSNIKVEAGINTTISAELSLSAVQVSEVEIVNYDAPLIEADEAVYMYSGKKDRACGSAAAHQECAKVSSYNYMAYDPTPIEYNTENYDVITENNFKNVTSDPLSTFSVDVDRASYSNIRRFLSYNQMPNADAVRIEEMINYFDYDYPQPDNGDPFSITVENGKCPWNEKHNLVLIGLKGENLNEEKIPANNLVFLLDVSGSMSDANKLPLLKQAFKILVNNLRPQDKVSIVVYAGAAGVVLEPTAGDKKANIIAALENLQSGGSTAGGEGIKLAYKLAKENLISDGNNRVILATDGDFNIGASSDAEMVRLIEEKRNDGIFLTILGFGMGNYKDSKLESISNAGNGNYAYIDNIMEAKKIFGKELWGTLYTIAKDVKIQVEFNPTKVKSYRLIGYENRLLNKEDFNDDKKDAGEIGCGHTVTALYEIIPADSDEDVSQVDPLEYQKTSVVNSKNIMTVKVRYKKPKEDTSILIVQKVEDGNSKFKPTANLNFAASIAEFGMLLRSSEHKGSTTYDSALLLAKNAIGKDEYGFRNDFLKMVETAQLLSK